MKDAMSSNVFSSGLIVWNFKAVKTILTLFKRALLNLDLPHRFALVQETKTHFGAVFGVATRFCKSFPYIIPTLLKSKINFAINALHLLYTVTVSPVAS